MKVNCRKYMGQSARAHCGSTTRVEAGDVKRQDDQRKARGELLQN